MLALLIVCFAGAAGYVRACVRVTQPVSDAPAAGAPATNAAAGAADQQR